MVFTSLRATPADMAWAAPALDRPSPAHLQRLAILGIELALAAQESWHEEVEEAPQLHHVVLDGGAGQQQSVLRHHAFAGLQGTLTAGNQHGAWHDGVQPGEGCKSQRRDTGCLRTLGISPALCTAGSVQLRQEL